MDTAETLMFPERWNCGVRLGASEAPIQVHAAGPNSYILRQSKTLSYEAPFLYLMFGRERAVLWDTGATADSRQFPLRQTVDRLIAQWLQQNPHDGYSLVVAHTHAHGDHVAADGQFADRPLTTIVGHDREAVSQFFGVETWPDGEGTLDLGGRRLVILPIPGHHQSSVAVYDPWSRALLTGDTIYPGRLYVEDAPAFLKSIIRLGDFSQTHPLSWVLGCHIEMTRKSGRDYPVGCTYQPDEPPLGMAPDRILAVHDEARRANHKPGRYPARDFIIYNGGSRGAMLPLMLRGLVWSLGRRFRLW